jgi:hypothetical protein
MNLVSFKNARQQLLRGFCYFFGVVALHRFFKPAVCIQLPGECTHGHVLECGGAPPLSEA